MPALCKRCHGNGQINLTNGVTECWARSGSGWEREPAQPPAGGDTTRRCEKCDGTGIVEAEDGTYCCGCRGSILDKLRPVTPPAPPVPVRDLLDQIVRDFRAEAVNDPSAHDEWMAKANAVAALRSPSPEPPAPDVRAGICCSHEVELEAERLRHAATRDSLDGCTRKVAHLAAALRSPSPETPALDVREGLAQVAKRLTEENIGPGRGSRLVRMRAHLAGNVSKKALLYREDVEVLLDAADAVLAALRQPVSPAPEGREALDLLAELHALVWGECPALLNEDSGGCARLDMNIRAALRTPSPHPAQESREALVDALESLIPIADRMLALLDRGETVCFDNYADQDDAIRYAEVIDKARAALSGERKE
jgi:hypothetical protein